jgi:hypothetical protein
MRIRMSSMRRARRGTCQAAPPFRKRRHGRAGLVLCGCGPRCRSALTRFARVRARRARNRLGDPRLDPVVMERIVQILRLVSLGIVQKHPVETAVGAPLSIPAAEREPQTTN